MKALLIGDDLETLEAASRALNLRWPNRILRVAVIAAVVLGLIEQERPDVVLLQADLSDVTPATAIQEVRRLTNAPLLVLVKEGGASEVVTMLGLGADDYVSLQNDPEEIAVRIFALIRRTRTQLAEESRAPPGGGLFTMDALAYAVDLDDQRVHLTPTEFRLLDLLVRNQESVVSHEEIELALWGETVGIRTARRYVQQLRRKLGDNAWDPRWIVTVHWRGYRYIGPPIGAVRES